MTTPRAPFRRAVLSAALSAVPFVQSQAQTNGTWDNPDFSSWSIASNWIGSIPDGGGTATLVQVPDQLDQGVVVQDLANVTLTQLNYASRMTYFVQRPTGNTTNIMTLTGASVVNAADSSEGSQNYGLTIGHRLSVPVAGSNGLTKTGAGGVWLSQNNTYTGGTTLNGGIVTVQTDAGFGDAAGVVTVNAPSQLQSYAGTSLSGTRNFVLNADLRVLTINTGAVDYTFGGVVSGTGGITKVFNGYGGRALFLTGANTYQGATTVGVTTIGLSGNGQLQNTSGLRVGGIFSMSNTATPLSNRVSTVAPVVSRGGLVQLIGNSGTAVSQTFGKYTSDGGLGSLSVEGTSGANAKVTVSQLERLNNGLFFFRGLNLGATEGPNASNVYVTSAPALVGGGGANGTTNISIIKGAYGAITNSATASGISNSFVTYGANGIRPLNTTTEYVATIAAGVSTDNVRLTADAAVSGASTVNSLVVGAAGTVSGTGTLTVASGMILNLNALGTVTPSIDFGSTEGIIIQPAISLIASGTISGSGGLTKGGAGTLTLSNTGNNYSGTTTLAGGRTYFNGNLPNNGTASALGVSTSDIVVGGSSGGVTRLWYDGSGMVTIDRNIKVIGGGHASQTPSFIGLGTSGSQGDQVLVMNGTIDTSGGGLSVEPQAQANQQITIFNGKITGSGLITDSFGGPTGAIYRFNGNNDFTGGVEMSDGAFLAGSNTAFGTGTFYFTNGTNFAESTLANAAFPGAVGAVGGARTLSNPFNLQSFGTLTDPNFVGSMFIGDSPLTLSGVVDLGDNGQGLITVAGPTPQNITFSGTVYNGGFIKRGDGTLTLSGNNTFTGQAQVEAGTLVAKSNNAFGSGSLTINTAENTAAIEFDGSAGNLTINNEVFLLSSSAANGALYNVAGNNVLNSIVGINNAAVTIGANAGTKLSIALLVDNSGTLATSGLTKVGAGEVQVDSVVLDALTINDGTLSITADGGSLGVSAVSSLAITGTSRLNLRDNSAIVDYPNGGPSPINTIRGQLQTGFNSGAWNGNGIVSSTAAATATPSKTMIAYAESSEVAALPGILAPFAPDADSVLLFYTLVGDATFDRKVNTEDFNMLAGNFGGAGSTAKGDFNYDGTIDSQDFTALVANFGSILVLPAAGESLMGAEFDAFLAAHGGIIADPAYEAVHRSDRLPLIPNEDSLKFGASGPSPSAAVPEPASITLLALAGAGLVGRRRRIG